MLKTKNMNRLLPARSGRMGTQMKIAKVLLPLSLALLSGCVVGPDYKSPTADLPSKFSQGGKAESDNVALNPWWEAFRDKKLNSLVGQGLGENLNVQQSLERVVEARANVTVAASGGLPQITANGSASAAGQDGSYLNGRHTETKTVGGGGDASWLIDLFGQYARAKESANASLDAAYADVNVARLAYLSDLTNSYIEARYNQEAYALQQKSLASRRETLKLTNDIKAAGAASSLDVVQAEGLVNTTLAELPGYQTGFNQAANHIATLLGLPATTVTAGLRNGGSQPSPRYNTKIGIPADLVRNRPDIRRAERLLAAATAQIGVAESQLYPSLTLSGNIDGSRILATAATGGLGAWSFGPSLNIPIFNGGRLKANVDIAKSGAQQQYLSWKQTVLQGVEEVENALVALRNNYQTVAALRKVVDSYEEALGLARESYKGGATSLLDVLDAERNLANSRIALAAGIRNLANNYVSLNVAIGGGAGIEAIGQ
jgi:multidrug efflux system outer membrane protein